MFNNLKILYNQGKQYIPDVRNAEVPGIFRGRPVISNAQVDAGMLFEICPTNAIEQQTTSNEQRICIDIGKCTFCGECALAFPDKIKFSKDYKLSTNDRQKLIISEGEEQSISLNDELIRKEIYKYVGV